MDLSESSYRLIYALRLGLATVITLFSILLCLQVEGQLKTLWLTVFCPLFFAMTCMPIAVTVAVYSSKRQLKTLSKFMLLFTTHGVALNCLVFTILLACKLDGFIDSAWATVFVPVWLGLAVYLLFVCFLCPGLVDPKAGMHRFACVMLTYFLMAMLSSLLIVLIIDNEVKCAWSFAFLPIWIGLAIHALSFCLKTSVRQERLIRPASPPPSKIGVEQCLIVYLAVQTCLIDLRLEGLGVPMYAVMVPLWLGICAWIYAEGRSYWTQLGLQKESAANHV
jgi:hypothetical protein